MTDRLTPQQRHNCMSHIRAKDTKPELVVRRWLWKEGWRYRLYVKGLPGKPDIVLRKIRTVIFVNGCFWHGHNVQPASPAADGVIELTNSECCKIPQSNRDFWVGKIQRNRQRDLRNYAEYLRAGWHVLVVWECMLQPKRREQTLRALSDRLQALRIETCGFPTNYDTQWDDELPIAAEPGLQLRVES